MVGLRVYSDFYLWLCCPYHGFCIGGDIISARGASLRRIKYLKACDELNLSNERAAVLYIISLSASHGIYHCSWITVRLRQPCTFESGGFLYTKIEPSCRKNLYMDSTSFSFNSAITRNLTMSDFEAGIMFRNTHRQMTKIEMP